MPDHPSSHLSTGNEVSRRDFLKATAVTIASPSIAEGLPLHQDPQEAVKKDSETLVKSLYETFTPEQKKICAFPFGHPLRSKVDNNWFITKARVDKTFTPDQQAMIREIFVGLHSPDYADVVMKQVEHDSGNRGFGNCSIAIFGEPGTGKFEFVLTGRHVTRRCDGDSVKGMAFGGPIFYGHAAHSFNEKPDHPDNAYWFQALRANKVFGALDGKQRKLALRNDPKKERGTKTVELGGKELPGISMEQLSEDQKELVRRTMGDLLAPFRKADVDETMKCIETSGFDQLSMAFYQNRDIGKDGVWDVWQLQGPDMLWFFRGAPHVHAWAHVREPLRKKS